MNRVQTNGGGATYIYAFLNGTLVVLVDTHPEADTRFRHPCLLCACATIFDSVSALPARARLDAKPVERTS